MNRLSGTGVAGMNVLFWGRGGTQYQATTDDSGGFRIEDVTPGEYYSRFEKEGFVPLQSVESPLRVTSGKEVTRMRVEVTQYATLRGRVLDPDGAPASHFEVEIYPVINASAVSTAVTDDEGIFRFDRLTSGTYLLRAKPEVPEKQTSAVTHPRREIIATFFPSATERAQAEKIAVRAGYDLTGYELRLRTVSVFRLSGIVLDEAGKPAPRARVALSSVREDTSLLPIYGDLGSFFSGTLGQKAETGATAEDNGTFEFPAVQPGSWRLTAYNRQPVDSDQNAILAGGAVNVIVDSHDVDDLRIRLAPMVTLNGTVEFSDGSRPSMTRTGGFTLATADGQGTIRVSSRPDGTIHVANLLARAYRVLPLPALASLYSPSEVWFGNREVLGEMVELAAGMPPLRVALQPNSGVVRGTTSNGPCAFVLLLPNPFLPSMGGRGAPCQAGGAFEITGLPAGQYYALAFESPTEPIGFPDLELLSGLLPNATSVRVDPAAPSPSVQLSVMHWPE